MGTQTCVVSAWMIAVRRLRQRAVTALKLLSQEPQSRSIADLVAREVVNGPGVSRMGSRSKLLIAGLLLECNRCALRQQRFPSRPVRPSSQRMIARLPGGIRTHWKAPLYHGAHPRPTYAPRKSGH